MSSTLIWMIALAINICAVILGAAMGRPDLIIGVTCLVGLAMVWMAVRERSGLIASGASRSLLGASTARNMGLIWIWGALGLFAPYAFILQWKEWWHFVLGFAAAGILSLMMAILLKRDAETGREDETMLTIGRYLVIGQLVGMILTVVGLLIDPDKSLLTTKRPDWAANSIFFFGALALGAVSIHSLIYDAKRSAS